MGIDGVGVTKFVAVVFGVLVRPVDRVVGLDAEAHAVVRCRECMGGARRSGLLRVELRCSGAADHYGPAVGAL